jgi:hypothetical protein
MKEIRLSQHGKNRDKFVALVDDEDYEYFNQFSWSVKKSPTTYYAIRTVYIDCGKITLSMHRIITCTPLGMETDHKDHNGLNNQKYNLRICTHKENGMNQKSHSKSGYLGVYYSDCYIIGQIAINNKVTHLGIFKTEKDAAMAYDRMAKIYHGEFANLNFPNETL